MRKFFSYPVLILCLGIFISSCQDESKEKKAEIPKDSTTTGTGGGTSQGKDTANTSVSSGVDNKTKNSAAVQPTATDTKNASDKSKATTPVVAVKKNKEPKENETTPKAVTPAATVATNATPPAADNTKIQAADLPTTSEKPFVYKYGLIPWDATADNITSFKNAFPDKGTVVKINFDNDPDAAMQNVKTQIVKALHDAGYTNVDAQSKTFHPARIPKDIHYELQHDGTVVIWL